jgi:hypothetical protein
MYKKDGNQITRITTKDTFKSVEGYKLMASDPTTSVVSSFMNTLIDSTILLVIVVVALIILILHFYRKK